MILAAKFLANLRQRAFGQLSSKIHGNLAWKDDLFDAFFPHDIRLTDIIISRNLFLNQVDRDHGLVGSLHALERFIGQFNRDGRMMKLSGYANSQQRAFQLADVGVDLAGNKA